LDVDALWSVQAMLVTRGALNRFGKVIEFADMEKDDITIDSLKYMLI